MEQETRYKDFGTKWYFNVGATICFVLANNAVVSQLSSLSKPFVAAFKRYKERGYNSSIKKEGTEDDVNTKMVFQTDLQAFYTNPQILADGIYSKLFAMLWSCLAFSAGLPILYAVGAVAFFMLYWVNKILLIKFYAKNTQFDEDLPVKSAAIMKFGLVFHLLFGAFMFSNSTILEAANNLSIVNKVNDRAGQYQDSSNPFVRFFSSPRSILYMTVILGLVAFKLAHMLLGGALGIIWKILTCKCLRKDADNEQTVTVIEAFKSNDIYKEMDFKSLDEFYKRCNRDKNDFERSSETIDDKYID